ncbi:MAG: hypothetical protein O3A53_07285 [Acidobacteria bacterium]|nr:hypothetical protein [Acidobacteriota bacterium]MDA1234588.1 hypothetical protein [Acidobacteriota bacterium]
MAEPKRKYAAHPESAPGDFYVINDECIICGAPHEVAPDLIAWTEGASSCIWKKQPATPEELEQAISVIGAACCDSHRYAGSDPEIMSRIPAYSDQVENHEEIAIQEHWKRFFEDIRRRRSIWSGEE